ncbi:MAG: succinylglutamate desuccinylase/aspartoacylase family protein [Deltaproteobacteria bacterium]|nr:succinylglutamate desuccinylase/aspartoacylase family protein [Deltaproteobacteria bacterium]
MDSLYAVPVDPVVPPAPVDVVNQLEVGALPEGLTRLFVELVGDGLGHGIRVPVMVMRGTRPGPVFGLTACLHGNELNGIPVIHELFRTLTPEQVAGTVVGVVALNVPGLHRYQRGFTDGTDLNRIMPGKASGSVAEVYAHRILDRIVGQFGFMVDLHTASFGRVNSLYVRADMRDRRTAAMAYLQRPQIIVHNPASDRTLRGAAMAMGIPSVTLEIGDPQLWQEAYTRSALEGVRAVLAWAGVIEHAQDDLHTTEAPVLCRTSSWMYTDRGGLLEVFPEVTGHVEAGERVARVRTAFGDVIREYEAPAPGVVVGKSVNPVGQTGARILHLGELSAPGDGLLGRGECGL